MNDNNNYLITVTRQVFADLGQLIEALDPSIYATSCSDLSGATIGQHTRHILELYECLIAGYETTMVNYELRKRSILLETQGNLAIEKLKWVEANLQKSNKNLQLVVTDGEQDMHIATNFSRELWYNFEHCIHHMALIKVAVLQLTDIKIPESFGVAPGTLRHRQVCAQ